MAAKQKSNNSGGKGYFRFRRFLAWFLLLCVLATILFLFLLTPPAPENMRPLPTQEPDQASPHVVATIIPSLVPSVTPMGKSPAPSISPARHILYIVIDDAGNNVESIRQFLAFPGKLTFSVLPSLPHSREVARLVRQHGQGLMLHQPMEAIGGQNPGPGVVKRGMAMNDVEQQLKSNLDGLETADGVNNHMGSLGTQDRRLLEPIMRVLKERHLFFLDSRTSAKSKAIDVAHKIGVPSVERDVFLDNDQNREAILQALQEGAKIAEKRGYAVMIGHAWSAELAQVLIDTYPHLVEQGYDFDSLVNYFLGGKGFVDGAVHAESKGGAEE